MSETNNNVCPCCGRHCDLSAPGCERGEKYLRTGVIPERRSPDHHSEHRGHGNGPHNHHDAKKRHEHSESDGRRPHPPRHRKNILDSTSYETLDIDSKLTALLREMGNLERFHMDRKGSQNRILWVLAREGGMTQRALTERLGIQSGSASEVLGKLEKAGLIRRDASETDRRTVDVSLTELGAAEAAHIQDQRKTRRAELFSSLTEDEKVNLLSTLETLLRDWQGKADQRRRQHQPAEE